MLRRPSWLYGKTETPVDTRRGMVLSATLGPAGYFFSLAFPAELKRSYEARSSTMNGLNDPALPEDTELEAHPYAPFLRSLDKPARYTGGEVGSRRRAWEPEVATVCLAFPDVYDIGMSHLGFKILYRLLNDDPATLAERCYAPWVDLEAELRARNLPLVSLESKRPLRDFDVVGFSLQFELTYTNILNMLELGRIPLRAADRGEDDPLVIAGGPVATHPEPLAPFIDAIVLGDGEEKASQIARTWKAMRLAGIPRAERLVALARLGSIYVPSLYATELEPATGLEVVARPTRSDVPFPVERALVDLAKYPFPDDSPTGGPEAIFDRVSIEVARGCTEGCRFCQAGMIYRPVRERDPQEIVDTVVSAVKKSGHDEVSLTALSTADVSCISPLIKKVVDALRGERVALGVSSLRAYGLEPDLLDEIRSVRATGLTFAPEAGTQRMRDVINKNVTEEQLLETAERVFSRGFGKMKLYFICGLPTETDEDVLGIVQTGVRALQVGRRAVQKGKPAEVTVSVSVHVPKPHTPFQWCALDSLDEIDRKQDMLRTEARKHRNLKLKVHDARGSVLEGVFARGDRRLGNVLERAFKNGARFDSWEDQLRLDVWEEAFTHFGIEPRDLLGTLPVNARLPWSHLDVGLEDGFLVGEYRKALKSRLSPPCGKVAGAFVHETHVVAAEAERRPLVCYDCGVACDMEKMRVDRVSFLRRLGAVDATSFDPVLRAKKRRLPVVAAPDQAATTEPLEDASDASAGPPAGDAIPPVDPESELDVLPPLPVPGDGRAAPRGPRFRFRFEKLGPMALVGHLDLIRELPRVLRRVGIRADYTRGFHPKPDMIFAPALSLGVASLDEYLDIRLAPGTVVDDELLARMNANTPRGLRFTGVVPLGDKDATISRMLVGAEYFAFVPRADAIRIAGGADPEAFFAARATATMQAPEIRLRRELSRDGKLAKMVDLVPFIERIFVPGAERDAVQRRARIAGDFVPLGCVVRITGNGSVKASEVIAATLDPESRGDLTFHAVRTKLYAFTTDDYESAISPTVGLRVPAEKASASAPVA